MYVGDYPLPDETVVINQQGLDSLQDVNWTNEFFWGERYVIVSKRLFDLIAEAVPRIKRSSIPVFHSEEVLEYVPWAIPVPGQKRRGSGFRKPFEKK